MPVIFDNVIGSVVEDSAPPPATEPSAPASAQTISLSAQLCKIAQRARRLKAD
jgi:hypothetical protein